MRWFVEVSRVGESSLSEKYCVEAKQWQAALQEARKLRGDSGALSKFSIELLDDGYRAVDPSLKLRYLVNKAPADAPLTPIIEEEELGVARSTAYGNGSKHRSFVVPTALTPSSAADPVAKAAAPANGIPRPASYVPPRPHSNAPPRPNSNAPSRMQLVVPDDPVPPAPRTPTGLGFEPAPAVSVPAAPPPPAPVPPAPVPPAPVPPAPVDTASVAPAPAATVSVAPAPAFPQLPAFQVIRQRGEDPRPESPITYREVAYAVQPGTSRGHVEALLLARYREVAATIEERPPGKFIQLAVFDHSFQKRPERPPLATFAWKDWRGSPVLAFPGFGEPAAGPLSQVPPSAGPAAQSVPPEAVAPQPVIVPAPVLAAPPAHTPTASFPSLGIAAAAVSASAPVSAASSVPAAEPVSAAAPARSGTPPGGHHAPQPLLAIAAPVAEPANVTVEPPPPAPALVASFPAPVIAPTPVIAPAPAPSEAAAAPEIEISFDSTPFHEPPRTPPPDPARQSRPRIAAPARRRAGEDLISELFELMHELHFMRDVAGGADFVLSVIDEVLPCEGVLIHVFDINTNHFVVVRAKGPNARGVLLQRMSDQDPLAQSVMRSPQAVSVKDATRDPRFQGARWQGVGVAPKMALCGAVRQGGRYLGLIELVNPEGDVPFHSSELNALDYICEQFAEFLSNRPIIVAADVILPKN